MELLVEDARSMGRREHLWCWVLPSLFTAVALVFYFSGLRPLVQIVCPEENREWGLLENTQLLILVAIGTVALRALRRARLRAWRWGLVLVAAFALLVCLEEMDYGAHFVQLVSGRRESYLDKAIGVYNLHHQGASDKIIKRSAYGIMLLGFVIAPFLSRRLRSPWLLDLVPRPRLVITTAVALLSDLIPRSLVGFGILPDGGLGKNIGEFSEVLVYYVFLLYLLDVTRAGRRAFTPEASPIADETSKRAPASADRPAREPLPGASPGPVALAIQARPLSVSSAEPPA